jgi:hypothetical protein
VAFLWKILSIWPVFPAYNCFSANRLRLEWHLHTVEAVGSHPAVLNHKINNLAGMILKNLLHFVAIVRIVFFLSSFHQH